MRKLVLFFFLFIYSFSFSNAQSWISVGSGISGSNSGVVSLATFKGSLYAGGYYTNAGGLATPNIARWNGLKWDSVGSGIPDWPSGGGGAGGFSVYDSLLFVSGGFDKVSNISCRSIAQWNGTKWDSVGSGLTTIVGDIVQTTALYNKEIYAGGNYTINVGGKPVSWIARWNGKNWDSVGKGLNYDPWTFAVYKGELYAGGDFTMADGNPAASIARWNGATWDSLGSGTNGQVWALTVYNGNLYVGGQFTKAGGVHANNIAMWNGTTWDSVGGGINYDGVWSLTSYNGKVVAGGHFDSAGRKPASEIAYWDGSSWYPIGVGLQGGNDGVWALCVYDSTLYAGGDFTGSGSTPLSEIAMWSGPLGVNEIQENNAEVKVFPNPSNGIFNYELGIKNYASEIHIYNMLGKEVYSKALRQAQGDNQIDLSNQPAGIYLYRVITQQGEFVGSGKVIIE